jgi:hypothetical protein
MYIAISNIPLDRHLRYMNITFNKLKKSQNISRKYMYSSGITYHICLMPFWIFFPGDEIYYNLITGLTVESMNLPGVGIADFNVCENANTLAWGR